MDDTLQQMKNDLHMLLFWVAISWIGAFLLGCYTGYNSKSTKKKKPKKKPKYPNCTCVDPNQCELWCIANENYTRATNYSIKEECKHPLRITRVISTTATCETTVEECTDCGKTLTQPKTNC